MKKKNNNNNAKVLVQNSKEFVTARHTMNFILIPMNQGDEICCHAKFGCVLRC